jgi:hypothetical protein
MNATSFQKGQTVFGVRAGEFVVVGVRVIGGGAITVVDVREKRPGGKLGAKIGMTPECFKAAN